MERGETPGRFEIAISHTDGTSLVRLMGELDLAGAAMVEQELEREARPAEGTLVLDMSELTFIDSSGIRAVVMADRRVRDQGGRCVVVRGPERVGRVLDLTGVSERLELVDRYPPVPAQPG